MKPQRESSRCAFAGALAALMTTAAAQDFPTRPIRVVIGPGTDVVARLVGSKLGPMWGQQVIIDPRPGAGGAIAADIVAKSGRDGYSWLLSTAVFTINAGLYEKPPFDLVRDFSPVSNIATAMFFLTVHPSMPAISVPELIELARARPGQINYASSGIGTPPHLAGEMLKIMARINMIHVPYKSSAAALADLLGGQVQLTFQFAPAALPLMKTGKVRALAVSSLKRSVHAPELPTISEAGLPGYEVIGWNGVHVPRGTPNAVITKINTNLRQVLKLPDVQERLLAMALDEAGGTPEDFAAFVKKDIARFSKVIKEARIQPE